MPGHCCLHIWSPTQSLDKQCFVCDVVSTASSSPPVPDEATLKALCQQQPPGPSPCSSCPPALSASVGITAIMEIRLKGAVLLTPGSWETSWPARSSCSFCKTL